MSIIIIFLTSFFITFYLTPYVKRYFSIKQILDNPDFRSQHSKPIVRVGGISIYLSFVITYLLVFLMGAIDINSTFGTSLIISIIFAGSLFFLIGLIDDLKNLSPFIRLFIHFSTASLLWMANIRIDIIDIPYFSNIYLPHLLSYLITIFWIVGITNAINWSDGLDGLTATNILIYTSFLATFNIIEQDTNLAILSTIFAGSCLAFLKYNKYPANIIMGDGGSNLLGFIISILSIYSFKNINGAINFQYSLILLFIPLLDMIYVICKRILNKKSPFFPDRNHLHHRLLKKGLNDKKAVLIINSIVFINTIILFFYLKTA